MTDSTNINKKQLEEYKQTRPEQLSLFELLLPEEKKYSNTIELYDFIPKYFWGNSQRINDRFLEPLERIFECRGIKYTVTITPARVKDQEGIFKDYYPSQREELIEDALRKMACNGQGIFLDEQMSVIFSIYQLEQELKRMGHCYNYDEIKTALAICVGTTMEVKKEDGSSVIHTHIFDAIGLRTLKDWKESGNQIQGFVKFNALITNCIKNKSFRAINYEQVWSYKSFIARQLHKRLSHHYTQASINTSYQILLSTMIRDFGLKRYSQLRDNIRKVDTALTEMKDKGVILSYTIHPIIDNTKRSKILDARITIITHPKFNTEIKEFNVKQKQLG